MLEVNWKRRYHTVILEHTESINKYTPHLTYMYKYTFVEAY